MSTNDLATGIRQGIASTKLEGHEPSPEFLADAAKLAAGEITLEQMRAAIIARALATEGSTPPEAI